MGNAFLTVIKYVTVAMVSDRNIFERMKNKRIGEDADEFYNYIDEPTWTIILTLFITRLNMLILNAPSTTEPFMCFKGSQDDYVRENQQKIIGGSNYSVFSSTTRISSISIDYRTAKTFYDNSTNRDKTLYRVWIEPGCKLLFTTPFAAPNLKREMEFIIPCNHCFTSINGFVRQPKFNCFNSGTNLCHNKTQQIYSKDIVLMPIY
jgi:hypothetical protein